MLCYSLLYKKQNCYSRHFLTTEMPLKTYLINKIINQKFQLNGIVPSNRLPHKHRLRQNFGEHVIYSPDQLPPKVDLRPEMTPVEDQSQIGSW